MASGPVTDESVTVVSLAKQLDISKIYLEQVFSLLKRAGLVTSIKGAQGGYQLARDAHSISVYDILTAIEISLFEKQESDQTDPITLTLLSMVFDPIDTCLKHTLSKITLEDLAAHTRGQTESYMYYL
jgi:Rrf2 family protein